MSPDEPQSERPAEFTCDRITWGPDDDGDALSFDDVTRNPYLFPVVKAPDPLLDPDVLAYAKSLDEPNDDDGHTLGPCPPQPPR